MHKEFFEHNTITDKSYTDTEQCQQNQIISEIDNHDVKHSILDGFLNLLREKGVRVSTPEWLQFLQVIEKKTSTEDLQEMLHNEQLLNKIRFFAQTTLIKNKADESAFHEAFNEYFELVASMYKLKLDNSPTITNAKQEPQEQETTQTEQPIIKEQLGILEVDANLHLPESENEHNDNEQVHGGKQDQHNDILRKADLSKQGGGNIKNTPNEHEQTIQKPINQEGFLIGGKKGNSIYTKRAQNFSIINKGEDLTKIDIKEREKKLKQNDRRQRYEVRPDKANIREVVKNLRRIITDISDVKSNTINLKQTIANFARRDFRFDYEQEKNKQPSIVLLIDVGGPVDEWSPLIKEVIEGMTSALTKLEIYLFHNNLYGYVWEPNLNDLSASNYAKPNSLIDLKKIIKKRKKVIIYGDAEMSYSEFEQDGWPPDNNEERIKKFSTNGDECLKFIQKKADSTVWINPIFAKEWQYRDTSNTIKEIGNIIPMHDLTVGGVEDAIKELMKKK